MQYFEFVNTPIFRFDNMQGVAFVNIQLLDLGICRVLNVWILDVIDFIGYLRLCFWDLGIVSCLMCSCVDM